MGGAPELQELVLEAGAFEDALARLPARAGVAQLLDESRSSLLIAQPANLRRWVATQLGLAPPRKRPLRRPPVDLRPLARRLRFRTTRFAFEQRLAYERLMARHVPLARRRDLRPPGFLRLELGEPFPRLEATGFEGDPGSLFGPFRDRAAAARARDALNKQAALRPCDFSFEPDPELPLGLACLYAQMRSCAAPCLARVSQAEYRELARRAVAQLEEPGEAAWRPDWLARARPLRAVVAESRRGEVALFPVRDGAVLDEAWSVVRADQLEDTLARLPWAAATATSVDWPWLAAWLHAPRRKGVYVVVAEAETPAALAARLREALGLGV